jgi:glucokinase
MMYIGIDVGATKIKGIIFNKGEILNSIKIMTPSSSDKFIQEITNLIKALIKEYPQVKGVGICFPGNVNREKGIIIRMPNLPKIKNLEIIKKIKSNINLPIKIENDGKCAVIAEFLYGEGKGKKDIIALTLGTGIGGGTIVNKTLCIGRGNAGEVGHVTLIPDGIKCTCGGKGCFEAYAASKNIMRMAKIAKLNAKNPLDVENLARNKNKKALEIYQKIGYYLGIGIGDLIKIFDPEVITISGSISNASDLFLEITEKELDKRVFFNHCNIKISKIKDAPVVGAASLFEYYENKPHY